MEEALDAPAITPIEELDGISIDQSSDASISGFIVVCVAMSPNVVLRSRNLVIMYT